MTLKFASNDQCLILLGHHLCVFISPSGCVHEVCFSTHTHTQSTLLCPDLFLPRALERVLCLAAVAPAGPDKICDVLVRRTKNCNNKKPHWFFLEGLCQTLSAAFGAQCVQTFFYQKCLNQLEMCIFIFNQSIFIVTLFT